MEPWKMY